MDVSSIAALATTLSGERTRQAVGVAVMKKAMDVQSAGARQLIDAVQTAVTNPPHLGNAVDTFA